MRRPRALRSRLFSWFFGAILLAILTSSLVVDATRTDSTNSVDAAARHIAARLANDWDDPAAVGAYVSEVRDVTGFEVRLLGDSHNLPGAVRRAQRHGALAGAGLDRLFVPVERDGVLLGALEFSRPGVRPARWGWWRPALALFAVLGVLLVMARRVAHLLAQPLEQLARAADRFGGGDLAFRADVGRASGWVALEVRDVALSFNRMADRVEATVRGQRELLGAISHELRSPLGRARVALEIARERFCDPRPRADKSAGAALDDVDTQLGAIDTILGELLDLTRAGLADLRRQKRDFAEWLSARIAEEPTPPAIDLQLAPEARGVSVDFDAGLLARAVHNLLVNARTHGHPSDRGISVRVARHGDRVRVVVRDHGPGFPPGFAERAFEPFARGDAARTRPSVGPGYGLGLAIVRRVVEAHGGRTFARNVADEGEPKAGGSGGAEVAFDLPLAAPPR